MSRIRGLHLDGTMVYPKREANGVRMNEAAIRIGTQASTMKAVDIRVHGGTRELNGVRMTGGGKGEKMSPTPRSIKIGIITELVHRGLNLARMEPLGMVIWWALDKILKVMESWWVQDRILQHVHVTLRIK